MFFKEHSFMKTVFLASLLLLVPLRRWKPLLYTTEKRGDGHQYPVKRTQDTMPTISILRHPFSRIPELT